MIRSLYRRLERLEEQTMPMDEPKVWQIVILCSTPSWGLLGSTTLAARRWLTPNDDLHVEDGETRHARFKLIVDRSRTRRFPISSSKPLL
jgi:hypothetical protein